MQSSVNCLVQYRLLPVLSHYGSASVFAEVLQAGCASYRTRRANEIKCENRTPRMGLVGKWGRKRKGEKIRKRMSGEADKEEGKRERGRKEKGRTKRGVERNA